MMNHNVKVTGSISMVGTISGAILCDDADVTASSEGLAVGMAHDEWLLKYRLILTD